MSIKRYDTTALGLLKTEEEEEVEEEEERIIMLNCYFLLRSVHAKIELYSDVIHSFHWKSAIKHDGGV